ncbi:MAG: HvfC/BufC N-terminal domain-containing protein [Methylophilaceae bacterium]
MSELAKLQADFQASIINQDYTMFKKRVIDDAKVGAEKRLTIYADAYRLRIIEVLSTAYAKLHLLLGDDLFDSAARQYIDQYPSEYRNMRWVGDRMDEHLLRVLSQHPYAAELAQFEWALGLAFDAEDAAIVTLEELALVPTERWGGLRFKLHPAVQLLDFKWNVIPIWQALNAEEAPPPPQQNNTACLVWRTDLNSHYRSIDAQEFQALLQIKAGASFGDLCEYLYTAIEGASTQQAAQYLASWLEAGIISQIKID